MKHFPQISLGLALAIVAAVQIEGSVLNVTVDKSKGHEISPILWGIFFEEINHAGDGGK